MYNAKWTDDAREYIIRGSAGVGKNYFIENDVLNELLKDYDDKANYVERFFVSKYSSYEELFGGYMPMDLEKNGKITYEFMPGPMAKI